MFYKWDIRLTQQILASTDFPFFLEAEAQRPIFLEASIRLSHDKDPKLCMF